MKEANIFLRVWLNKQSIDCLWNEKRRRWEKA